MNIGEEKFKEKVMIGLGYSSDECVSRGALGNAQRSVFILFSILLATTKQLVMNSSLESRRRPSQMTVRWPVSLSLSNNSKQVDCLFITEPSNLRSF